MKSTGAASSVAWCGTGKNGVVSSMTPGESYEITSSPNVFPTCSVMVGYDRTYPFKLTENKSSWGMLMAGCSSPGESASVY